MNDKLWNLTRSLFTGNFNTKYLETNVEVQTIDKFSKTNNVKCDILKIDVESYELEVLNGAIKSLKNVKLILIEISDLKRNFQQKFKIINDFLEDLDFYLLKQQQIKSVSFLSKLKAIDCIYVKNN